MIPKNFEESMINLIAELRKINSSLHQSEANRLEIIYNEYRRF